MKKYILLFLLVFVTGFSQNLNEYKYAIVPAKFSFLKEENMYNLNVLTKMFMQKYGFETYLSNETAPDDFVNTNCNKVFVDVIPSNGIFTTKIKVVIKDCKGTILCSSEEGSSRDKEYRIAYNEALRMAFDSFNVLKMHQYKPSEKKMGMIGEPTQTVAKTQTESPKSEEVKPSVPSLEALFAKPFGENGFQLLTNNTNVPQYVMTVYKTSSADCYIASKDSNSGVLLKKGGNWFFEYYKEGKLVSQPISIVNF